MTTHMLVSRSLSRRAEPSAATRVLLQRRAAAASPPRYAPALVHEILASGRGQPLDAATRGFFEPRYGHDFGRVRVHTDETAGNLATSVNALAFTVGRDVVFAPGQYAPGTPAGRRRLAHELAHVVQQVASRASAPAASDEIEIGPTDDALEQEAEAVARGVADADGAAPMIHAGAHGTVARMPVLQRDDGGGEGEKEAPAGEEGSAAKSGVPESLACDPVGLKRKDFLATPRATTDDFGLTRLAGTVKLELSTTKVKGGVVLDEPSVTIPPITSNYTKEDTFIEGTTIFFGDPSYECKSGRYPLEWTIFPSGARTIREGELEHCADLQYAYQISLKYYAGVVSDLAKKKKVFASEKAAFTHLAKVTKAKSEDWVSIFECLAKKTEDRDGTRSSPGWHTINPGRLRTRPPKIDDGCAKAKIYVDGGALPEVGKHPTPGLIQGCGENPAVVAAVAKAAAAASKAAGEGKEGTEAPTGPPKSPK